MEDRPIPVTDRRAGSSPAPVEDAEGPVLQDEDAREAPVERDEAPEERDLLDDLMRLQADFDNYRKRVQRDQATSAARGVYRLMERLLPVLDNFELALAHGEGGSGVELVLKELSEALRSEGLEPIESDGATFDPRVHEAVESREAEVDEPKVIQTYRRGYMFKDQLMRPAMVVVGRPARSEEETG